MSRRSRAREVVLQLLYEDDLNPDHGSEASDRFLRRRLNDAADLIDFAARLLDGVRRHRPELDRILEDRADHWSLARMAATDRNALRIGAYEILHTDAPAAVAINEAVELAKRFGTRHSAAFVNGVLDQLAGDRP